MLQLIITILLNLGFTADSGKHFVMNSRNADIIKSSTQFRDAGGETEFSKFTSINDVMVDDIIIVDDDNPSN